MPRWSELSWSLVLFVAACATDYEGEKYPRVADADEIEIVDVMPTGYRVIGTVSSSCDKDENDEEEPLCSFAQVERRMRRKAAQNGGELLVEFRCETRDSEYTYWSEQAHGMVTSVATAYDCTAQVARAWEHDRERARDLVSPES